jgi:hypothetical protein
MGNVVNRVRNITVVTIAPSVRVNDFTVGSPPAHRDFNLFFFAPFMTCWHSLLKEKRRPFDHVHDD